MLPQGSQCAAGRAERSAARVGEGSAPDRVVLERAGLAAGAEVRVGRRFHGRHAGVIGVQVGVIHFVHGGSAGASTAPRTRRGGGGDRAASGERVFGSQCFYSRRRCSVLLCVSGVSPRTQGASLPETPPGCAWLSRV